MGFCDVHHLRWVTFGSPHLRKPRGEVGAGRISEENGYRYVHAPGHPNAMINGQILEHRLRASEHLGRALLEGEEVHHRNGQRTENTVGPCLVLRECKCQDGPHNLELWSKRQPAGQRVADKVAWAKEMLTLYESSALTCSCRESPSDPAEARSPAR